MEAVWWWACSSVSYPYSHRRKPSIFCLQRNML